MNFVDLTEDNEDNEDKKIKYKKSKKTKTKNRKNTKTKGSKEKTKSNNHKKEKKRKRIVIRPKNIPEILKIIDKFGFGMKYKDICKDDRILDDHDCALSAYKACSEIMVLKGDNLTNKINSLYARTVIVYLKFFGIFDITKKETAQKKLKEICLEYQRGIKQVDKQSNNKKVKKKNYVFSLKDKH